MPDLFGQLLGSLLTLSALGPSFDIRMVSILGIMHVIMDSNDCYFNIMDMHVI